jgi:peptidoglycan/xylan/chitin deacetylase (PgdA/CDA1 family)
MMRGRIVPVLLILGVIAVGLFLYQSEQLRRPEQPLPEGTRPEEAQPQHDEEPEPDTGDSGAQVPPRPTTPDDASSGWEEGTEEEHREPGVADLAAMFPQVVVRERKPANRLVALTFDDGPDSEYTPQILEVLRRYGVRATFFVTGVVARRNLEVLKQLVDEGHVAGNHGYHHVKFSTLSPEQVRSELEKNEELLAAYQPNLYRLFRPPYSDLDVENVRTLAAEGYRIVLWTVDSQDWRSLTRHQIINKVLPRVRNGSIILMHCAGGPGQELSGTVRALPELIARLRARGYQFVTIPDLLASSPN